VIAIALVGSVPIILAAYSTQNASLFFLLSFMVQFVTASALGASAAASQALVQPQQRGVATAIFFLGTTLIGLALGPFLAGYVSEMSGSLALGVKWTLVASPFGLAAIIVAIRRVSGPASEL
jgi:MFS family permease